MKLLHIIAQKPGETGSGIFLKNLIKAGAKKNYGQYVIAGISKNEVEYSKAMPDGVKFCPVCFETEALPFPVVGMSDVMPYKSTRYSDMSDEMLELWKSAFLKELNKALEFKPDLIIMHHLWILAALARKVFPGTIMIGICHGTDLRQLQISNKYRDYVIEGCRKIDGITALSPFQKEAISKVYGIEKERITVTGAGFDEDIFFPPIHKSSSGPLKIVYAGKLSAAKGVPDLISAVSSIPMETSSLELILAGSGTGWEVEKIKLFIQKCPFRVELLGSISQKRLGEVFRECHLFVLPSFYEGLSLVTIEALASGLQVVANDLPGMREWIGKDLEESGMIEYIQMPGLRGVDTPIEDELESYHDRLKQGIIKQLRRVDENPYLPEKLNSFTRRFSWSYVLEAIENIYKKLNYNR